MNDLNDVVVNAGFGHLLYKVSIACVAHYDCKQTIKCSLDFINMLLTKMIHRTTAPSPIMDVLAKRSLRGPSIHQRESQALSRPATFKLLISEKRPSRHESV